MANTKISALPALNTVDSTTVFPVSSNTSGTLTTYQTTIANVASAVLASGNSNIRLAANGNVTVSSTGNSNVFTVTGTGANVTGTANITGNANVGNLGTGGLITATGNVSGGNLTTAGDLSVTGNANVGNLGTATAIITTGNITTINSGLLQNGNSNVAITANANITLTSASNATMVVTGTGANIAGTANVTGNISAGNINAGNTLTANYVSGTLTTAAQPNVTSVGTLSSITVGNATANVRTTANGNFNATNTISAATLSAVSDIVTLGNITGNLMSVAYGNIDNLVVEANAEFSGGNVSLGAVGNLHITGGTANYLLQTDGAGNLTWVAAPGGASISNGTSNVSIATSGGIVVFGVAGNANVASINGLGIMNLSDKIVAPNADFSATLIANVAELKTITTTTNGNVNLSNSNVVTLGTIANLRIAGGSNGQVLTTDGAGNVSWGLTVGAAISNGTSNVTIAAADGNVNVGAAGNANILQITGTGVRVTGIANISGEANLAGNLVVIGNTGLNELGVGGNALISGNVTATSGGFIGLSANISGNANVLNLNANGAVSFTGDNVSLGAIGNLHISGGTSGYALITNGTGTLSWGALGGSLIANGTSNVTIAASGGNVRFNIAGTDVFDVASNRLDIKNDSTLYFNGGGATLGLSAGLSSGDPATIVSSAGNLSLVGNAGTGAINLTGSGGVNFTANLFMPNIAQTTSGTSPLLLWDDGGTGKVGYDATIYYDHTEEQLHVGNVVINDNVTGGTIGLNESDQDLQFTVNKGGTDTEVMRLIGATAILKIFPNSGAAPATSLGGMFFNNDAGTLAGVGLYFCANTTAGWQKVNLT